MNEQKFERFYRFVYGSLGFFAVYFIVCAFIVPLLAGSALSALLAFLAVLVLMLIGYYLQAAFCALKGIRREVSERSYESDQKFYSFKTAFPVLIPAAVLAFISSKLTVAYLSARGGGYYDTDSLLPFLAAGVTVAAVMMGSFVWFFPYDRLTTGSAGMTGMIVTMAALILFAVAGSSAATVDGICLCGFAVCSVVASNQHAISRTYRGTVVSFLTPKARGYNMVLALCLILAFGVLPFFSYVIVSGVRTLGLMLTAALLSGSNTPEGGYSKQEEAELYSNLNKYIYGNSEPTRSPQYWYMLIFFVFVIGGGMYAVFRHTDTIKRLVRRIKDWILALIDMIFRPMMDFVSTSDDIFCNYVDVEEKMQDAQIREYREQSGKKRTYREFMTELRQKRTEEEKYRYAYSTYIGLLRSGSTAFRSSDTPRETARRLHGRRHDAEAEGISVQQRDEFIDRMTENFEKIEFAAAPADSSSALSLDALCGMIKKQLG